MPLDRRDIVAALVKKGFIERSGDHEYFIYWTLDGRKTSIWTKTSHGSSHKTVSDVLVSAMAKQCGLTSAKFRDLVACPLSRESYERHLAGSGRIKLG